ncbi:hypothetical protein OHC33_002319 [Knufia fluminis]|uniref:alpha-glucosidase n=1 Tax=Knufia fluminis TaxID=191047 RepID=A0AAN8EM79_9EURO|nr:hypothetical protein OHC33_002319 [Knufia fluminis]
MPATNEIAYFHTKSSPGESYKKYQVSQFSIALPSISTTSHKYTKAPSNAPRRTSSMKDYKFETKPQADKAAIVQGANYRFTILTDRLVRYEWAADGKFEDRASIFAINRQFPVAKFQVYDQGDNELKIVTDHFVLSYDKERFSPSGLMVSFNAKITNWGAQWRFGDDETRSGNFGGTARTLDEVDGRCDMGHGVNSSSGYAAINDSDSMLLDGSGWVSRRMPGDRIDGYLFGYGHDYRGAVKALYKLSGDQPVLPRWALGNWWSRYYAYTQDEYIQLMDKFRSKDLPLSVAVIDMDWHLVDDERVPHAGWTGYTWDDKLFPDPESFGRELHSRNLKITLNDHPAMGVHHHESSYEEMAKYIGHDTSSKDPILFDPTNKKFMEAYLSILHRNLEKQACDFWWIDWQQGHFSRIPNVDPLWMLNHFHFLDNATPESGATASTATGAPEKRPLIFSRYAGPGSHRYPVGFSGDTIVTWASLAFQPEFTNTASNIGYGWWSHDIGGHMLGSRDDELVARWVQYGVFSPIMRLHSSNSPWGSKEPWCYRPEFEKVVSDYMRLRHRMVPYLYTLNVTGSSQGEPLCQPIYWHFPEHGQAYAHKNEYFFGFELLVAPIVEPRNKQSNMAGVKAWLPPLGRFVDVFTGTVYDEDRDVVMYRQLHQYPVLMHEGSIVVLDAASAPVNGCLNPEEFEVYVCVGKNGQASVLEAPDDDSEASKKQLEGKERGALIQYKQDEGTLTANVTGRTWSFRFVAITEIPKDLKVTVNGKDTTADAKVSIEKYPNLPSLVVKIPQVLDSKAKIKIDLGKNAQLSKIDQTERMKAYVLDFQIDFGKKDELWSVLTDKKSPLNVRMSKLLAMGMDEAVIGPFAELLLADSRAG